MGGSLFSFAPGRRNGKANEREMFEAASDSDPLPCEDGQGLAELVPPDINITNNPRRDKLRASHSK